MDEGRDKIALETAFFSVVLGVRPGRTMNYVTEIKMVVVIFSNLSFDSAVMLTDLLPVDEVKLEALMDGGNDGGLRMRVNEAKCSQNILMCTADAQLVLV